MYNNIISVGSVFLVYKKYCKRAEFNDKFLTENLKRLNSLEHKS